MSSKAIKAQRALLDARMKATKEVAERLIREARASIRAVADEIDAFVAACPHERTTKHQGSLVGQQWVQCNDCDGIIKVWQPGEPAFHGPPDVRHTGTGNTPRRFHPTSLCVEGVSGERHSQPPLSDISP